MKDDSYSIQEDGILATGNTNYILKVRDMASDEKPREKMQKYGSANLNLAELIAIVLGTGTKKEEVMTMSRRIIKEYGEKALLTAKDPKKLSELLDIPIGKASQIVASFELGRRFYHTKNGMPSSVRNASQAYKYFQAMAELPKEIFKGIYLNSHYQIICDETISVGTVNASMVHPRDVLTPAIERGAVAIIVAHNHPSGSLDPTEADIIVTNQLVAAAKVIGIELLDHIIVSKKGYASIISRVKID
jgi:DNA repair protein RadC